MTTPNLPNFKSQPTNQNLALPTRFQMVFARLPNVTFYCQSIILPSITATNAIGATPFVDTKLPGDKLVYAPLSVMMLVDEDLRSYREVHDWIRGYTFPTDFSEYRGLKNQLRAGKDIDSMKAQYSDVYIHIFNSNWRQILTWKFIDAFPLALGELSYSASDNPQAVMQIEVTFEYQYFDIIKNEQSA